MNVMINVGPPLEAYSEGVARRLATVTIYTVVTSKKSTVVLADLDLHEALREIQRRLETLGAA